MPRSEDRTMSLKARLSLLIIGLVAAAVLAPILSDRVLGYALAAVAGIMVFVALDELIPVSREFNRGHWSIFGIITGMVVMATSLALLTRL